MIQYNYKLIERYSYIMLTKDEFETNIQKCAEKKELNKLVPQVQITENSLMGFFHTQAINIVCPPVGEATVKGLERYTNPNLSYQFIYTLKTHTLDYQHGIVLTSLKYKHFKIKEDNWGNLFKSCLDLLNYDWLSKNEHAMHVLKIAPNDFMKWNIFCKSVLII